MRANVPGRLASNAGGVSAGRWGDRIYQRGLRGIGSNTPEAMNGRGTPESLQSRRVGMPLLGAKPATKSTDKPVAPGTWHLACFAASPASAAITSSHCGRQSGLAGRVSSDRAQSAGGQRMCRRSAAESSRARFATPACPIHWCKLVLRRACGRPKRDRPRERRDGRAPRD